MQAGVSDADVADALTSTVLFMCCIMSSCPLYERQASATVFSNDDRKDMRLEVYEPLELIEERTKFGNETDWERK